MNETIVTEYKLQFEKSMRSINFILLLFYRINSIFKICFSGKSWYKLKHTVEVIESIV